MVDFLNPVRTLFSFLYTEGKNLAAQTNPNGSEDRLVYNEANQITETRTVDGNGNASAVSYDGNGNLTKATLNGKTYLYSCPLANCHYHTSFLNRISGSKAPGLAQLNIR